MIEVMAQRGHWVHTVFSLSLSLSLSVCVCVCVLTDYEVYLYDFYLLTQYHALAASKSDDITTS